MEDNYDDIETVVYHMEDKQYNEMMLRNEKEKRQNMVIDKLGLLYECTIGSFHKCEMLVYNPNIFSKLTKEKFIGWVINNNPNLRQLFS
ncbi:hypothetical protein QJ856_gp0528 [Tupanvirus deep ocean]|uniref:Uncharacterized protein n=2 Tax=Tupanvirus TaxID=2094720 RepID=A0AC62A968_9VIRU|nr:hypothetical protein QJ856_gp0528 [Tupanvirus deep ocean]QKU34218.1 hypothetical protein [Tupanvirus deep ocean]